MKRILVFMMHVVFNNMVFGMVTEQPEPMHFPASGGTRTSTAKIWCLSVSAPKTKTLSSDADGVSVVSVISDGVVSGGYSQEWRLTIAATIGANPTLSSRNGKIKICYSAQTPVVHYPEDDDPVFQFTQSANTATVSPEIINARSQSTNFVIEVGTDDIVEWAAQSDCQWIELLQSTNKGAGVAVFAVHENKDAIARSGTVTVAGKTVEVTQQGQIISSISYTKLHGASHDNPATYIEGSAWTFNPPNSIDGYTFCEWNPQGITTDMTGEQTVVAEWRANEYSIVYHANGGVGDMGVQTATYDTDTVIAKNDFTNKGSVFRGWATSESGAVAFTELQTVRNLTAVDGDVVNLYAVWELSDVPVPVVTPASGTIISNTSLTVSISCSSDDVIIHYTTNGLTPTLESPTYKKFKVYGKTIVKAIAFADDGRSSAMATAEYAFGACSNPVIMPEDGTVFEHSGQVVSLAHDNPEGVLRYTIDGSDPTAESPEYTEPFTIDETTVVKAKVFGDQYFDSSIVTATLTRVWLKVDAPVVTAQEAFTGSQQRVDIDCATEGAVIRYTTNGAEPNSHSAKYTKPFYVTDTTMVKAYATKADYTNSDIATFAIAKVWGIGDTMGKPDHTFETSGDKGFVRVEDTTATLGEAMKSGAITDNEKSILSTTVIGPGTLTFKWKASCEEDDEYEWDHGEFRVNGGAPKGRINGVTDWIEVSQRIDGKGTNTVTWTYVKDDVEAVGQDCIWVSDYAWKSDYTETQTTQVPVPYDWLKAKSRDIVDEYENYEKVAKQTAYNKRLTVEQCYVAGVNPESATNDFMATIGPDLSVGWKPDLKGERIYKVWSSTDIVNGGDWEWPTNALHRFFKVTVEMP